MFDQLVETKKQRNERSTRVLVATASAYAVALVSAAVVAVFCFNPQLSEASSRVVIYDIPRIAGPRSADPVKPGSGERIGIPRTTVLSTTRVPEHSPATVRDLPPGTRRSGGLDLALGGSGTGAGPITGEGQMIPGLSTGDTKTLAPPPGKPEPVPPVKPTTKRVSEGVLKGFALQRVTPVYPMAAQHARISGVVVVQLTISEEGRVIDVRVISGPILLQDAAVRAAREWVFAPTLLSRVPVKVQGILSFDFKL